MWIIRNYGFEESKHLCKTRNFHEKKWLGFHKPNIDINELEQFINKFESYSGNVKIRLEVNVIDIYIRDYDTYNQILYDLEPWIRGIWEPENQESLNFLLSSNNIKILCDDYPYNKYKYKVYIKYKINEEARKSFSSWIKHYPNKIYAIGESAKWLENDFYFVWNPSIYVEDQATLSMIGLFLGGSVQKVEEYVTRNSINTP